MKIGSRKGIVDSTLWPFRLRLFVWGCWVCVRPIQCATLAPPWHPLQWHRKRQKKHTRNIKHTLKWVPKSMPGRQQFDQKSSLRFRSVLATKKSQCSLSCGQIWIHFGSHFQLKVEIRDSKINTKIDTDKASENVAIEVKRGTKVRRSILRIEGSRYRCTPMKKRMRKLGPKKICGIQRKQSQNWA